MTKAWTTSTGESILIREMSDSHLVNTIKFLQRRAFQRRSSRIVQAVQMPFMEDEAKELVSLGLINFTPKAYMDMVTEANSRGLYFPTEPEASVPPYMMRGEDPWQTEEDCDGKSEGS